MSAAWLEPIAAALELNQNVKNWAKKENDLCDEILVLLILREGERFHDFMMHHVYWESRQCQMLHAKIR